jgi:hypothetical protein
MRAPALLSAAVIPVLVLLAAAERSGAVPHPARHAVPARNTATAARTLRLLVLFLKVIMTDAPVVLYLQVRRWCGLTGSGDSSWLSVLGSLALGVPRPRKTPAAWPAGSAPSSPHF